MGRLLRAQAGLGALRVCFACALVAGCAEGVASLPDPGAASDSEVDTQAPAARRQAIDAYVGGLELPVLPAPERRELEAGPPTAEGDYVCATRGLEETRRYDRLVAFAPGSAALWPGALVRGTAALAGELVPVVLPRAPLTFSVSLENLAGARSAEVRAPSLSSFRDALRGVLAAKLEGATAANIAADIEEVSSREQLELALGASASFGLGGLGASVGASFDFADSEVRGRYVVKYLQSYYTVDVDPPSTPSAFLGEDATVEQVRTAFGPGELPLYVSSVTYGRLVVFAFESSVSARELGAALDFAYRGAAEVSGRTSLTHQDVLARTKISAFIVGGSAGSAAKALDSYEALRTFIREGGNYSKDSPGAPIAYKLSALAGNVPAQPALTQAFSVKECSRMSQRVQVVLERVTVEAAGDDSDRTVELFGKVAVRAIDPTGPGDEALVKAWTADQAVTVAERTSYPSDGSTAGEAIVRVRPRPGSAVELAVELHEADGFGSDDFGVVRRTLDFETGWRQSDLTVHVTHENGTKVSLVFSVRPI